LIDEDPRRAAEGFHTFTWKLLRSNPPPQLRRLPVEDQEDVIAELVTHCIVDDFRVLRAYRDRGVPFAGFVAVAANRRATSRLREIANDRNRHLRVDNPTPTGLTLAERIPDPTAGADERVDANVQLERVLACLSALNERCQILIQGAAEGRKPKDLVFLLGWSPSSNKKASDALRECRKTLTRCVEKDPKSR
jgi:DNA-directed RNA polymerase specialized sigma24 family protein